MAAGGRCFVVAPGEGRLIDLAEFEIRVKADVFFARHPLPRAPIER